MLITSVDNKKIKIIKSLKEAKNRKELGLFVVEGEHLVKEAFDSGLLEDVYILENETIDFSLDKEPFYVTEEIMRKISSLPSITKVVGVCKIKNDNEIKGDHLLILEDIQDPGNLGTIIRSSVAFSIDTIILSPKTVDIYNEKVIRSTQGMLFKVNIVVLPLEEILPQLREMGYLILGTNVNDGEDIGNVDVKRYALIMGNEGQGLSEKCQNLCDKFIYIRMNNACESLNVAVATSILLYELGKKT